MLSIRWKKVVRDLMISKTRTVLVVLSIAVGVFSIGAVMGAYQIIAKDMKASYLATNPAHANIYAENFGDGIVDTVASMREVTEAEGRRTLDVRVKSDDGWKKLRLYAISDFQDVRVNKFSPVSGEWPPSKKTCLLERESLKFLNIQTGGYIEFETPEGKMKKLQVSGVCHDVSQFPTAFSGTGYAFVTFDTLAWLGEPRNYDILSISVKDPEKGTEYIREIAEKARDKIEGSSLTVYYIDVPTPGEHPAQSIIKAILFLMGIMGVFCLFLSGFLVVNTINAIISQQIRQIGMMKAIGGRKKQIVSIYIVMVLCFGLAAVMVSIPLGYLSAIGIAGAFARMMNFDLETMKISPMVFLIQAIVGIMIPLMTAMYPVFRGARISVREALSDYGIGNSKFGHSWFDRLLEKMSRWSRPLLLSLRNTFRKKGRLALTMATLVMGGAIFITVFSIRASMIETLDAALSYFNYDVEAYFSHDYRTEKILREAKEIPGVVDAESWGFTNTRIIKDDDTESNQIFMLAPPAETKMLNPTILEGRWLLKDDDQALVINTDVLRDNPDLKIGKWVVLKIKGRDTKWQIVGLVQGLLTGPIVYSNYPYYNKVAHESGRTASVQLATAKHDAAYQNMVVEEVEKRFKKAGIRVTSSSTTEGSKQQIESQFNIIAVLLLFMAVLMAVVGGLGLMGTMSINVIERTREIGVMRAIGASNYSVLSIFITEGMLIGLISWIISFSISLPISKLLSDQVGNLLLQTPLTFKFSLAGVIIWLIVVIILSSIASFIPAWRAASLSVREILAYE